MHSANHGLAHAWCHLPQIRTFVSYAALTPCHDVGSIMSMNGHAGFSPPLWTYVVAPYGRPLCAMLVSWQRVCVPRARRQSPLSWDPLRLGRRQMALPVTVTLGRGRWDQQPRVKWSGQTCVITQDERHQKQILTYVWILDAFTISLNWAGVCIRISHWPFLW